LRFGSATRLYYFSLPFFHELDPRATRTPLKVHAVFRPEQDHWVRLGSDELDRPGVSPSPPGRKVFSIEKGATSGARAISRPHK
jgi:hypothetical protein